MATLFSASKLSFNRNIHIAFTSIPSSVVLHLHTRDSQSVRTIADEVHLFVLYLLQRSSLTIELNYVQFSGVSYLDSTIFHPKLNYWELVYSGHVQSDIWIKEVKFGTIQRGIYDKLKNAWNERIDLRVWTLDIPKRAAWASSGIWARASHGRSQRIPSRHHLSVLNPMKLSALKWIVEFREQT
jgi:hypothetical protein